MKRIIILVLSLVFLSFLKLDTFATDACDRLVPQYASFMWKATITSNLRSYPCTYKSSVLWVSKPWDIYTVISKVDWWYQIQLDNWKIYRIWDRAISKTNDVVKKSIYVLSSKDNVLVNRFVNKMNLTIQNKGLSYRDSLVTKISDILNKKKYSDRLTWILNEIINRIKKIEIIEEESKIEEKNTEKEIVNNTIIHTYNLENIDILKVKDTWLSWYNDVRKEIWVNPYSYDKKLESSALDWSKTSKNRWEISHKRNSWDVYYDYNKITSWFKDRWVVCKNIYRATHTENIWWWAYSCKDWECTDELISSIRSTFDFYMNEKWTSYDAHYKSIVHRLFTKIWLWIELEDSWNWKYKYYLTVHYCTELINF